LVESKGASQKFYILIAVVGVVVVGGILLSGDGSGLNIFGNGQSGAVVTQQGQTESQQETETETGANEDQGTQITTTETVDVEVIAPAEHTVEMTSSGFSPNAITISKGDTVTFVNADGGSYWPASAIHPTHTVYPGSNINKCATDERSKIFDACENIKQGESWSFTFNEVGEWNYHDHNNPSRTGTIVVQ
jgi:plastocyanin